MTPGGPVNNFIVIFTPFSLCFSPFLLNCFHFPYRNIHPLHFNTIIVLVSIFSVPRPHHAFIKVPYQCQNVKSSNMDSNSCSNCCYEMGFLVLYMELRYESKTIKFYISHLRWQTCMQNIYILSHIIRRHYAET